MRESGEKSRQKDRHGRVLLLTTPRTYRAQAFQNAAGRLGIEVVEVVDTPRRLARAWEGGFGVDFSDQTVAETEIVAFATSRPVDAVMAVDDSGTLLAARAAAALGLPHNAPEAAAAARDKFRMRTFLRAAGVPTPRFERLAFDDDWQAAAGRVGFPAVVKPLDLSGSRGVMRVDDERELAAALIRLRALLAGPAGGEEKSRYLLESYIPGVEVALEGLLDGGRLRTLALFDKPDPLEGPFFEETIYVNPSRLPTAQQQAIAAAAGRAAEALGLQTGPIHAELRLNEQGPWVVEVAGRSIGGRCSETLRFGVDTSLEELILRQACGLPLDDLQRTDQASGVMMIPIPEGGMLRGIGGLAAAEQVPLIDRIDMTAQINHPLVPLPEGESYLGFIFASGDSPAAVEAALRAAHAHLTFEITPHIPLLQATKSPLTP